MNITSLMLAFLFHLQSQGKLDLCLANKIIDLPYAKSKIIYEFIDNNQWELYTCMNEALDSFIEIESQKIKYYA